MGHDKKNNNFIDGKIKCFMKRESNSNRINSWVSLNSTNIRFVEENIAGNPG